MPTAGGCHVNIRAKARRNSLVSDPEDMRLLREKLTLIAVAADGRADQADDMADEVVDQVDQVDRRRRRPPPFAVFGLPAGERPSTPPSSPQPRDVLRRQLRVKNQAAAARRRLGSASVAGSDDEQEGGALVGFKARVGAAPAFVSVDEVEITRAEEVVGPVGCSVASPRVRLSIPSHLRVSSSVSVLSQRPEGMRKRKSVHVEDAVTTAVVGDAAAGRSSLKKTSSQVNMLSHDQADDRGPRLFKSFSSGALFHCKAIGNNDEDMEDAWPDPEPPESPEASLDEPEK